LRVPGAEHAIVTREKLVDYLLNEAHPVGSSKARFLKSFGFAHELWPELANRLIEHLQPNDCIERVNRESNMSSTGI
jgi:hypothetical protein